MRRAELKRPAANACCPVVELRQYLLKPGRRDDLIDLFDRHFVESQERHGARIIGQFCNRNDRDQFVWMRGFTGMAARCQALQDFYGGPVWSEHRDTANDTMIDSDNVLLLKPAGPASGLYLNSAKRPQPGVAVPGGGMVLATIYYFDEPVETGSVRYFETHIVPALDRSDATLLAYFVSEPGENTFPALPVREGENVFVWFASFADELSYAAYHESLNRDGNPPGADLSALQARRQEILELIPTNRSLLRHTVVNSNRSKKHG